MSNVAAFSSVKLPGSLVQQAKSAALVMRRSTAGQIEYWAMLGQVVEAGGLTVKEAARALSTPFVEPALAPQTATTEAELADIALQFENFGASGALAQAVRAQVALQAARVPAHAA